MKRIFRGYYKLSEAEIQNVWDNGFISLDTNVLFNIYKYSDETRKELFRVIRKYSPQLWLTNHAAFEFHKNRIDVISDQIDIYGKTVEKIKELESEIIKNRKTPHLSKSLQIQFEKTIKITIKDLENKKEFYKKLLLDDTILTSISTIFNNKVGDAFLSEEMTKIEKEGEERYKRKVPPGFKDNAKGENRYGDLIIWKELINKAKAEQKPFIFISDDMKEDWWLRTQGTTVSPRQELSQELYRETQQVFHMYTPDRFLEFAARTGKIKQETIDEVREVRKDIHTSYGPDFEWVNKSYTLSLADILRKDHFLNNINASGSASDALKSLRENWEASSPLDYPVTKSFGLKTVGDLVSMQNALNSISNNPLARAYLIKSMQKEDEKKEDKEND